jgi:hypothetical protein
MGSIKYDATGVAGSAGSSSAGTDVAVKAGDGNGTTNRGGNVNLKAGAAVSTGIPGEYQANSDANMFFATFNRSVLAATDEAFFLATRACIVKTISQMHGVAAGSTSTMTVMKDTGVTAAGGGTSLHQSGSFNLNATANTVQNATVATTQATVSLAAGDRLSIHWVNTVQSSAGLVVTVGLSYL